GGQGGIGGGLLGGTSAAPRLLGMRHGLLNTLAAMSDGAGMPIDGGRLLGEAAAEGRRGIAPLMLGLAGGRLALRGAYGALIGRRPKEEDESVRLLRHIAHGQHPGPGGTGAPGSSDTASGRPGGPGGADGGMVVNKKTGEVLHDPTSDRPLIGARVHQRAMRFRGYRIVSRTARIGYRATLGAPRHIKTGARKTSEVTQDAQTQLRVVANQVREDAGEWASAGRATAAGIDHVSQRAAATWQAYDPATAVRTGVRNAAAGAIIATSATTSPSPDPSGPGGGKTSAARQEDPAIDARHRVFDALMRAQRTGWDNDPTWGRDPE
ncbi:hypothetical protein PV356_24690, partial [Streptomyces sp. WI03-5b]|nr:hypothetical protein [Streptomyces sp. WI03-5b]